MENKNNRNNTNEWITKEFELINLDQGNFLEIVTKTPPKSDATLVAMSKGWFNEEGEKRYKANILYNAEQLDLVIGVLEKLRKELTEQK